MSFKVSTVARGTGFVGALETHKGTAKDAKSFKTIIFKVVSNQRFKSHFEVGGKVVFDYKPDFVLCKATEGTAQYINDFAKEPKIGADKKPVINKAGLPVYVSRLMELDGHLETYEKERVVKTDKNITINEESANVKFQTSVMVMETIFVVENVQFLDKGVAKATTTKPSKASDDVIITPISNTVASNSSEAEINDETISALSENSDVLDENGELPVPF